MNVGSLVQQFKDFPIGTEFHPNTKWIHGRHDVLTIRQIRIDSNGPEPIPVLCFEEGIGGYSDNGVELGFPMEYYKELMPPIDNVEEFINQNTLEKVEI